VIFNTVSGFRPQREGLGRETFAHHRETVADQRETVADQRETFADQRQTFAHQTSKGMLGYDFRPAKERRSRSAPKHFCAATVAHQG
jgi:hypothetical protein